MTRNWSFFRLRAPASTGHSDRAVRMMLELISGPVCYHRSADSAGRWFFKRLDDHFGRSLGLWFHSTETVLAELEQRLRTASTRYGLSMVRDRDEPPSDHCLGGHSAGPVERLSTASSDFALALLRGGELGVEDQVLMAVRHLCHLVDLIGEKDRLPFLFCCWQHWTHHLTPGDRIGLGARADTESAAIMRAAADRMPADLREPWRRYLSVVRGVVNEPNKPLPTNYLLFDHAHQTHSRFAISAAREALAVRVVRKALHGAGATSEPVLTVVAMGIAPSLLHSGAGSAR